jgi:hypothetical protein
LTAFDHEYSLTCLTAEEEDAARDAEAMQPTEVVYAPLRFYDAGQLPMQPIDDADFDSLLERGELDAEIAQFVPAQEVPYPGETLADMHCRIVAECQARVDAAGDRCPTVLDTQEPSFTIKAPGGGRVHRAWLEQGRVVSMTPRALARFQSFPDSYLLPEKSATAVRVIGNAVPPKLYEAILRTVTEATK